nr:TolC family protein [Myxococcota bacterium]
MTSPTRALALLIALSCIAPASVVRAQEQTDDVALESVPEPPASAELIDVEGFLRGEGRGITAEDVARAAVRTAPSIDATRAQLAQAQAGANRAMLAFFPRLELQGRYTRLSPISQPNLFDGGGGITPEQEEAARALISSVTDPAAQTLFFANLEAQLAQSRQFSSFSFPVILDNYALGASLTIPVTDLFLQVWPSYEAAQGAARAQEHQVRARSAEVAQQAREAFYQYA